MNASSSWSTTRSDGGPSSTDRLQFRLRVRARRHHRHGAVSSPAESRDEPRPDQGRLPAAGRAHHGHEPSREDLLNRARHDLLAPEEQLSVLRLERHQSAIGAGIGPRRDGQPRRHEYPRSFPVPPGSSARPISAGSRSPIASAMPSSTTTCPGSVSFKSRAASDATSPPVAAGPRLRLSRGRGHARARIGPRGRGRRPGHPLPTRTPASAARRRQVRRSGPGAHGRPRPPVLGAPCEAWCSRRPAGA